MIGYEKTIVTNSLMSISASNIKFDKKLRITIPASTNKSCKKFQLPTFNERHQEHLSHFKNNYRNSTFLPLSLLDKFLKTLKICLQSRPFTFRHHKKHSPSTQLAYIVNNTRMVCVDGEIPSKQYGKFNKRHVKHAKYPTKQENRASLLDSQNSCCINANLIRDDRPPITHTYITHQTYTHSSILKSRTIL